MSIMNINKIISLAFIIAIFIVLTGCLNLSEQKAREDLVEKGIEFNNESFLSNIEENDIEIVKLFIDAGVNPNTQTAGHTALGMAAEKGNFELAKLLIENGADVNQSIKPNKRTPLMIAVIANRGKQEESQLVGLLIESGSDINAKTSNGYTALSFAVPYNNIPPFIQLLKSGADPNVLVKYSNADSGKMPLLSLIALDYFDLNLLKLLLEYGADPKISTEYGFTPLFCASNKQKIEILLKYGADIHAKLKNGTNVLMSNVLYGKNDLLNILINSGIDINAVNDEGDTALMIALRCGNSAGARKLLEHNADINIKNNKGETVFSIKSEKYRSKDIIKILEEDGYKLMKQYASDLHPEFYLKLGRAFFHGLNVKQDYPKAIKWLKKALEMGLCDVDLLFGDIYYFGYGVDRNLTKAFKYYQAAKSGVKTKEAKSKLAYMYYNGYGCNKDINKAENLLKEAVKDEEKYTFKQILSAYMYYRDYFYEKKHLQKQNKKELNKAIVNFKIIGEVFDHDKEIMNALLFLGWMHYSQKKYAEADSSFKLLLSSRKAISAFPEALFARGKCAEAQNKLDKACAYYERLCLMHPKALKYKSKTYLARIKCLLKLGKNKKAEETFNEMNLDKSIDKLPEKQKAREIIKKRQN
jgi:ankyrin repeat protein